tara:strand:- start:2060 stop:2881 length:822 start_codon:yes stop_codon:yes gene_type:complete
VNNKRVKKQVSEVTKKVTLTQEDGGLYIDTDGPIMAIEFNYSYNVNFTCALGSGFLCVSKNKKLMLVSLAGNSIEGLVLRYSGPLRIQNFKAVGPDRKFVQSFELVINQDIMGKLNSNWDSLDVNYEHLDHKDTYSAYSTINKNTIYENINTMTKNFKAKKDEVCYNNGKPYVGNYHIDMMTGILYTGKKPNPGMQPLTYRKNITIGTPNKLVEGIDDTLKKSFKKIKNNTKNPYSGLKQPGSTSSVGGVSSAATSVSSVGSTSSSVTGYGGG